MTRRTAVPFIMSALVLGACGSAAADEDSAKDELPTVAALDTALDAVADAGAFRATMAMGMDLDMGLLGQSMSFEADLATPVMVSETDADGDNHIVMNLASIMDASLGADSVDALAQDLEMEIWQSGPTMVMDLGGFAPILGQSSAVDALPADRFSVDVARLGADVGGSDAAALLSGQSVPDPVELARVLGDVLDDAPAVDGEPGHFRGQITFAEYGAAFGQDAEAMLGGMDTSFDMLGGADTIEALTDVFAEIAVDVDVRLDADGTLDVVQFDVDMSPLWAALPTLMGSGSVDDGGDGFTEQFAEMFEDFTFEMTMLVDYDLDAAVEVELPQGGIPDATDQLLELLAGRAG